MMQDEKIKEVKEFLENKPETLRKRVSVIYDGKQYNIRIPVDFAKTADINPEEDEFEFVLKIPENKSDIPTLYGQLISKHET